MTVPSLASSLEKTKLGWFHRYPARFAHETLVTMLVGVWERLGREPTRVLDPFAGTGATLALCKQLGIDSVGVEISQLGTTVARLRLYPPANPQKAKDEAIRLIQLEPHKNLQPDPELADWLGVRNAAIAQSFVRRTRRVPDPRVRRYLITVLSGSLRPASSWLAGSIKPQWDPNRSPSDLTDHVKRVAAAVARDCSTESERHTAAATGVRRGDAARLSLNQTFDAVVCSPPYFISYDYFDVQRLSYLAFNWRVDYESLIGRRAAISPDGVGFEPPDSLQSWYADFSGERTVLGRALRLYTQRMRRHLATVFDHVNPRGVVAYSIANSVRKGKQFPLAEALCELLGEAGFESIDIVPRTTSATRILPAGRHAKTGRFTSCATGGVDEYVIYAVRPNER